MRFPGFLKKDGNIGFVAPSFGCNIEPYRSGFDAAQRRFAAMGHGLVLGPNCYEGKGIGISNTPQACGEELTTGFLDENSDVLISCGGGECMCEILDYVDFEKITKADPKWIMGYSDNTNITFLLPTICDTASIYGPCAATFGMETWHPAIQDAYDLISGKKRVMNGYKLWEKESIKDAEHPLAPYNPTEKRKIVYANCKDGVRFEGRLIGGCMDCLVNLVGTSFDHVSSFADRYKEDGIIWFMEACDLNVLDMRRALWHMKHAGWFDHVRGFLIGRPYHFDEPIMGLDRHKAVTDILADLNVPILMDVDLGHLPPAMPVICGSYAQVSLCRQKLTLDMQLR